MLAKASICTPAERDIELVLSFLNTLDIQDGVDALHAPEGWGAWVRDRDLGTPGGTEDALRVRAALRRCIGDERGGDAAMQTAFRPGTDVAVCIGEQGPVLVARTALGEVLVAAARLAVLGMWERVKICTSETCRWAFYDRSRNRSRTWCSMRVCGNREKARIWREKHGQAGEARTTALPRG